jgi:hypothetical protein
MMPASGNIHADAVNHRLGHTAQNAMLLEFRTPGHSLRRNPKSVVP